MECTCYRQDGGIVLTDVPDEKTSIFRSRFHRGFYALLIIDNRYVLITKLSNSTAE